MGGLLAGLASLAVPMVARVLIAMGFSVVTITGVSVVVADLKAQILASINSGAGSAMIQLAGLAGMWEGLGMIFGAMTFCATYWGLTAAVRVIGKA